MRRLDLGVTAGLALLANGLLLLAAPLVIQAWAVLLVSLALPGWLAMQVWVGRGPGSPQANPAPLEQIVYAASIGFGLQTLLLLLLSYWPGPLSWGWTLLGFDLVLLVLWLANWCYPPADEPVLAIGGVEHRFWPRWTVVALALILLVAACLRLNDLGYTEFQGDEERAVTRAAAVIQGYETVLFLHRKGPLEILAPTATYVLTGHLNEVTARLPFALASLTGVLAVYLLGARLFGPVAGCVAALLIALDGYFIGFARIVQYQSIVLLTTTASVLILYELPRRKERITRYLTLSAFLVATGALAHYEALLALIPGAYLLWRWLRPPPATKLTLPVGAALLTGAIPLALFFVPYVLSPSFAATLAYLTDERIGSEPPYNHLVEFFLRTTLYSSSYAVLLQIALVTGAILRALWRGLASPWSWLALILVTAGLVATFVQPAWLTLGGGDWTVLFFAATLTLMVVLPGAGRGERTLWIWFGTLVVLALFLVAKPRTHVYVFFIPWALLAGMTVHWLYGLAGQRWSPPVADALTATALAACLLLFGAYGYWYFAHTQSEVFRTWQENRPRGYWTAYREPDTRSLFGFPIANGWKAVGVLYARGELKGAYTTNNVDEWVTDWYTRSAERCLRDHRYVIVADHLDHAEKARKEALLAGLAPQYNQFAAVVINDQPRLQIWQQGDPPAPLQLLPLDEYGAVFDAELSGPDFPLTAPAVEPRIEQPRRVRFGDRIQLLGYGLDASSLAAGEATTVTLYWRASGEIDEHYRVVNQLVGEDGLIAAESAGEPACAEQPTNDWNSGEIVVDRHRLVSAPETPPGVYRLVIHLADQETGAILPAEEGERVELATIEVTQ